jgi:hypothetical protein
MAIKKNTKKKRMKLKKAASKRVTSTKKPRQKGKTRKKLAKKKTAPRTAAAKSKSAGKKTIRTKTALASKKRTRERIARGAMPAFPRERPISRSVEQSGDLQGLSDIEAADSESVDELLEEGNAFEADVVSGVEEADDADGKEVHTHEVPEDDVPGEYLDEE